MLLSASLFSWALEIKLVSTVHCKRWRLMQAPSIISIKKRSQPRISFYFIFTFSKDVIFGSVYDHSTKELTLTKYPLGPYKLSLKTRASSNKEDNVRTMRPNKIPQMLNCQGSTHSLTVPRDD